MSRSMEEIAQEVLSIARQSGAEAADVLIVDDVTLSADVRERALEQAERSEGQDIGLRVFVGQKQAIVSSSDTKTETLQIMAERAVAMAGEAPDDPNAGLADADQLIQSWDMDALQLADPSAEPTPAELQEHALAAENAALQNSGISQVQSANASYSVSNVHMAASNGFSGGYKRTSMSISCVAIAGEGTSMERDYDGDMRIFAADLRSATEIGERAAQRAVERLAPRKPATGTYPVVFDERISSSLVGHLLAAVNGAAVARGSTWLKDASGEPVLPDALSIIEDPQRPRVTGSRAFDAEGLPTQRRVIVDQGVLTQWTLDLANARKLGLTSTGNAARGTSSGPSPSPWNIEITQGDQSREDLLKDMGTGLLVTSMIGSTINPNTGDYSRGASGFWVENGQIAYPVNECTIAGNLRDMLRRIIPANDARTHLSRVVPSLLIDGMTLAGS